MVRIGAMSGQLSYNSLIRKKAVDFGNTYDGSLPRSREDFGLSPLLPPTLECPWWKGKELVIIEQNVATTFMLLSQKGQLHCAQTPNQTLPHEIETAMNDARRSRIRVLQSSQIPRSSTKIKKPSSPFTDSGPSVADKAAWA
ncbi:hypothetical protein AXF42_Ash011904 [Apostasia shenzhenica]|uniref:Uncharacterized protein n=1 Tax=Apostasia shenzhenica TaxID=1088818 RepID=A0A2I0AW59_9ASPA|nr:hypothetical protein AXF42_Ash011904 [Apostasia shenzhenica]